MTSESATSEGLPSEERKPLTVNMGRQLAGSSELNKLQNNDQS
jgi:hypothetical protein